MKARLRPRKIRRSCKDDEDDDEDDKDDDDKDTPIDRDDGDAVGAMRTDVGAGSACSPCSSVPAGSAERSTDAAGCPGC